MPTIKDVAREAGVSTATVSYVLNNKKSFVSKETRRQVLETAERIGYRPNATARNLQSNQTRLIGYSWHEVPANGRMNAVLDTFTYYLAQAAEESGYHVLTFTHPQSQPVDAYQSLILTGRVDAFVIAGTIRDDPRVRYLIEYGFPFVSFGRSNPDWEFNWVDTDGERGVHEAVDYLLSLGHTRIAMAAWPEESISGSLRVSGYQNALQAAGLPVRPEYIYRGIHTEETGRAALSYWWTLPPDQRPTAVVAVSDIIAIGVMQQAQKIGLEVGKNLSIIGFDDYPFTQYITPALTTVQQPITEIGQQLMVLLEQVLADKNAEPVTLLLPPRLIIRDSCGSPQPV